MQHLSAILPFFSSVVFLCLGITVYFLSKGSIRKTFLKFCFITFHWQFSWFVLFLLDSEVHSDLICRIGYTGIIFLPVTCYESLIQYLKLGRGHIRWFYYLGFGFLASLWTTDLFIKGAHRYSFGFYPEAGALHTAYVVMVSILIILLFSALYRVLKTEKTGIRKNQLKFFFVAAILFAFSAVDYLLNYPALAEALEFQLYPVGVFFILSSALVFILSHFIALNLTLENRVAEKTDQLKQSVAALEEAARHKKNFIANVTHELRTPLTLIRGWTDFILEGETGKVPAKMMEGIDKIGLQTLNLTEKINELLKVSKFDAGMSKLVLTRVDVNSDIDRIVKSFKGLTCQRNIGLEFFECPEIHSLFLDREKLKDILHNLIRNAYKFTENGDIRVILSKEGFNMVITVEDTGVGMSEQILEKVFHRFRQGDGSLTRKYEGTGLGLAIVKESAELMHGDVSVKSTLGSGSSFSVTIPADLEKREPGAVMERRVAERRQRNENPVENDRRSRDRRVTDLAAIDSRDVARIIEYEGCPYSGAPIQAFRAENPEGTIVIAEDNKGIQDFLRESLQNYDLWIAPHGEAAWQTIQKRMPDLIISDIMMPVMDGYELLGKIRSTETTSNLPVIVITSLTESDDRIKSLQLGADDYLTKPFHRLELQARAKNVISVHKLEREKARAKQLETFLMVLASVIESKDKYTGGHVERVAGYAKDLARKAGLDENQIHEIYLGTIVHDVGKIGIKDEILNKPGELTQQEFELIREHPVIGKNILEKLEIAPVAVNIAYHHQEKWDGSGYPTGISKTEIPIEARIATIADFWDAITSDRPYRKALIFEEAVEIMHEERGKSFDPDLFDLFMDKTEKMYLKYIGIN